MSDDVPSPAEQLATKRRQRATLDAAISSGVLRTQSGDRSVNWQSIPDMMAARDSLDRDIASLEGATGAVPRRRRVARVVFSTGRAY